MRSKEKALLKKRLNYMGRKRLKYSIKSSIKEIYFNYNNYSFNKYLFACINSKI